MKKTTTASAKGAPKATAVTITEITALKERAVKNTQYGLAVHLRDAEKEMQGEPVNKSNIQYWEYKGSHEIPDGWKQEQIETPKKDTKFKGFTVGDRGNIDILTKIISASSENSLCRQKAGLLLLQILEKY